MIISQNCPIADETPLCANNVNVWRGNDNFLSRATVFLIRLISNVFFFLPDSDSRPILLIRYAQLKCSMIFRLTILIYIRRLRLRVI